ncbi:MAG TPA: PD-(D/E)XK nuclease family protein [Prolixibacteraceae bacterium]|nr:PD-(D/E)XK nuclease family protein [Prolixibacteraceae bacterium]
MKDIQNLLEQVELIVKTHNEILDATGGRFNVFKILNLTTNEVRLHSAFIAEFLDPKGIHGLKEKPLVAFINLCISEYEKISNAKNEKSVTKADSLHRIQILKNFNKSSAKVEIEKYIGNVTDTEGGRIDIVITDKNNHSIIIENKIYAPDQENQLIRYENYGKKNFPEKFCIFYLNLSGDVPNINSTKGVDFLKLTYRENILKWLEKCLQMAVMFPTVRETIIQYTATIKQLTGMSINKKMEENITDLILRSPENLENSIELAKNVNNAKAELLYGFFEVLEKTLKEKGIEFEKIGKSYNKEKCLNCFEKKFTDSSKFFGIYSKNISLKDDIVVRWGCELGENIYYGFIIWKKDKTGVAKETQFENVRKIIKECDNNFLDDNDNIWLCWQYTKPKLDFYEFKSDEIFKFVDKNLIQEMVNSIAKNAIEHINKVKEELLKLPDVF